MRELERDPLHTPVAVPTLAVVGRGRVGRAVARTARDAGVEVTLAGRRDALAACERADLALLCVPDSEVEAACALIAGAIPPLRHVGHVSGATPLAALARAQERGAGTFSLHPLQTIPDGETDLDGVPCALAASEPPTRAVVEDLASRLGMRPFPLAEQDRAAYHAAACMASNFLVTLEETAAELLAAARVEGGRELLAPLVQRTAENWIARGDAALTGPVARGDEATVQRHLDALEQVAPELAETYRALLERTRRIAERAEPTAPEAVPA